MPPIENQYVKGLTFRLLAAIIVTSISVTVTVVTTYYSLVSKITESNTLLEKKIETETHQGELRDLQFRELSVRVDALEEMVKEIKNEKK